MTYKIIVNTLLLLGILTLFPTEINSKVQTGTALFEGRCAWCLC